MKSIPYVRKERPASDNFNASQIERSNTRSTAHSASSSSTQVGVDIEATESRPSSPEAEEKEEPEINLIACLMLLVLITVLVAVTAEWLVDSISSMSEKTGLSTEFVALIMLPIVSDAACRQI
jgi:Ca2+:H+ antiporter